MRSADRHCAGNDWLTRECLPSIVIALEMPIAGRRPVRVIPAEAGIQRFVLTCALLLPACAGMAAKGTQSLWLSRRDRSTVERSVLQCPTAAAVQAGGDLEMEVGLEERFLVHRAAKDISGARRVVAPTDSVANYLLKGPAGAVLTVLVREVRSMLAGEPVG